MYKPKTLETILEHFKAQTPLRAPSLIISVWGDAVEPRGGRAWLGGLINLLEPFGVNERLMRTSVFRLTQDGWLSSTKVGRKSFYTLTESGKQRFSQAFRRVYSAQTVGWQGIWTLLSVHKLNNEQRRELQLVLSEMRFGVLGNSLLISPVADLAKVEQKLVESRFADSVVCFQSSEPLAAEAALESLVVDAWSLDGLAVSYSAFIELFQPLLTELEGKNTIDPQSSFIARTLLIHEYRKLVLRDPLLPDQLLPKDWPGHSARELCASLYDQLSLAADRWLASYLEGEDGAHLAVSDAYRNRFLRSDG
jgi:phenylacetic acid degradation operon negative regulatory protein